MEHSRDDEICLYEALWYDDANWNQISTALTNTGCKYLYIDCHGNWSGNASGQVTRFQLTAGKTTLYSHQWTDSVGAGDPDPDKPKSGYTVAFVTSLNRANAPLKFVWNYACYGGRMGAARPPAGKSDSDAYYGTYGLDSCYEDSAGQWNDMATALGITAAAAQTSACGYVGWYDVGWHDVPSYDEDGGGLCVDVFNTLAPQSSGRQTFEFTRQWIQDNRPTYRMPKPDGTMVDTITGKTIPGGPVLQLAILGK